MRERRASHPGSRRDRLMDIVYPLVVVVFFALTWGLVKLVGKL
jgi:hypothetical protein